MTIREDFRAKQIRRMAGLDDFPKFEPEAEAELLIVAGKFARSEAHLQGVIDEIMAVWTRCPKPSELRGALQLGNLSGIVDLNCIFCGGSGWRIVAKDGNTGAERCPCGSVPQPAGRAVPYKKEKRSGDEGLTPVKFDQVQ